MKRLTITGNMGGDPEMRIGLEDKQFVTFSVGVNVGNKLKPRTDWVDVTCNGKLAEFIIQHGKKGHKVMVDGFPNVSAYLNKDDKPVGTLKLSAHSVEILNWVNPEHDGSEEVNLASGHDEAEIE